MNKKQLKCVNCGRAISVRRGKFETIITHRDGDGDCDCPYVVEVGD